MLGYIFYFFGLFILFMSFSNSFNFIKYITIKDWSESFKKVTGKEPLRSDFRSIEDYNIFSIYTSFAFVEFIWLLVGISSASWYIFISIISIELILKFFILGPSTNLLVKKITGQFFTIFKFLAILFLILNHFHFHIDCTQLFR